MAVLNKTELKKLKEMAGGERTAIIEAIMSAELPEDAAVARHQDDSKKLLLPRDMSLSDGYKLIKRTEEDLEQGTHAVYEFDAHFNDMLVALDKAVQKMFGFGMMQSIRTFFGTIPPQERTIQTGLNRLGNPITIRVPAGRVALPGLFDESLDVGYLDVAPLNDQETKGGIRAFVKKKHLALVDTLIEMTRTILKTESIYQGQILDSQYEFLNLRDFDPDSLVLSKETESDLEAFVLTPIRQPEKSDALGIERNRAGLLYGVYGTGKTMTMKACAVWANREGWTSIIAKPGDSVVDLVHFGRQYQPAIITVEDIDEQASGNTGRSEKLNEILNTMSGVLGEEDRVMVLFTTNHPEKIHPGMLRPGRIHFAIKLGIMDGYGLEKLAGNMGDLVFNDDIKWDELADAYQLPPAYLKEGLNRVALYALTRGDDEPISHDDVRLALQNMMEHKALEESGNVGESVPELEQAFNNIVNKQVKKVTEKKLEEIYSLVDDVYSCME